MEKQFFIDGNFVILRFLETILESKNRDKTIDELLQQYNLLGKEGYILSPSLLISVLYGTFLIYQQSELTEKNEEKIKRIEMNLRDCFTIIKGSDKNIYNSIRNAIAHFHIDMEENVPNPKFVFKDRKPKTKEFHFYAETTLLKLRILLISLSEIM